MANKTNSSSNFFETLVDAQQQAIETMVENTKKFTNGNALVNETIEKGTEFFKKSVDATKETIDKATAKASAAQQEVKNTSAKATEFFANWKNQQEAWFKQMQEMNTNFLKSSMNTNNFQNPMSNMQNMWNNAGSQFDMNSMMNQMNPANMQAQFEKGTEQMKAFWNQFQNIMNTNYSDLSKNFQNGTLGDTYKGMFNTSEGFSKFYEMWMPMMKSMNDKTFNMDMFTKNLDMNQYKDFMDKFFSFMPQATQDYMTQMKNMYSEASKNGNAQATEMMNAMKAGMNNMMPGLNANPYASMLTTYNNMYGQMMNAVTPFAKLMTPNNDTKSMEAWTNIMNDMNIYNIKNAELQHMVYETGMKVMEKIATSTMHKIENGEEVNSMMKLYQDYLTASDKMYVELFETDEYSKLMAEVSSMKMSIKKAVELQMEKSFVNIPVATRSEMDEVYQTIYDLKKLVRSLEAKLNNAATTATPKAATTPKVATPAAKAPAAKPTAKKAAPKRK
ncbi:MAG TPA: poly(R)-hydroxyalkanoic acid synthase subunit PhaE [Chitinophagaceae bacterium]|nr:poly(R)-hydroxyalkanoic acid synthase subunit PhaE [Chitinophagaceae bacterium]